MVKKIEGYKTVKVEEEVEVVESSLIKDLFFPTKEDAQYFDEFFSKKENYIKAFEGWLIDEFLDDFYFNYIELKEVDGKLVIFIDKEKIVECLSESFEDSCIDFYELQTYFEQFDKQKAKVYNELYHDTQEEFSDDFYDFFAKKIETYKDDFINLIDEKIELKK